MGSHGRLKEPIVEIVLVLILLAIVWYARGSANWQKWN